MSRKLTFLLAALLCVVVCHGQIDFRFGPGGGVGVWGLGNTDEFTDSYQSYQDRTSPGKSVVAGLSGRWLFGRHLQVLHGLDYQTTTVRESGTTDYGYATPYPYATAYNGRVRLQQLVAPICVGVAVGGRRVRASFNLGARVGYIFSGISEHHFEYTKWSSTLPMPAPEDSKSAFLKGHPGDRFILQGMGSMQIEVMERVALSLNVAMGPKEATLGSPTFYPPRTFAYATLSFLPFGKLVREAPADRVMLEGAARFETGPEIGMNIPVPPTQSESRTVSEVTESTVQSNLARPILGWKFRFGLNMHSFVDFGIQSQFLASNYERKTVVANDSNTEYIDETGTIRVMKICMPLSVGYRWDMGKFQPFAALGVRENLLARRRKYSTFSYRYEPSTGAGFAIDSDGKGFAGTSGIRLLTQGVATIGTGIGRHLAVSLCYAVGPGDATGGVTAQSKKVNQDLFLTVGWRFAKGAAVPGI